MPIVPRKNMPTRSNPPPAQKKELGGKAGLKKVVSGNPKTAPHTTLKKYENSPADRRADASGAHGKEGSAKDRRADAAAVRELNRRLDAKNNRTKGY